MEIYVVRWLQRIDGEESCGNLKTCYTDLAAAQKAMVADFDEKVKEWKEMWRGTEEEMHFVLHEKFPKFRSVVIEYGTFDYIDWNVDKLTVAACAENRDVV